MWTEDVCRRHGDTAAWRGLSFLPRSLSVTEVKLNHEHWGGAWLTCPLLWGPVGYLGRPEKWHPCGKGPVGGVGVYTCVNHLEEVGSEAAGERGTCFSLSGLQRWRCAGVSFQLLEFRTRPDPSVPRGSFPWPFRGHPRSHYPTAGPVSPPCWRPSLPPSAPRSQTLHCLILLDFLLAPSLSEITSLVSLFYLVVERL